MLGGNHFGELQPLGQSHTVIKSNSLTDSLRVVAQDSYNLLCECLCVCVCLTDRLDIILESVVTRDA